MAKSRHALCSTSRGAEAKYQRSGMGQPATDFWMWWVRPSANLEYLAATLVARSEATGRPIGAMGAFLAATAEVHHLTLVTRNVSDFRVLNAVLNPWN